VSELKRMTQLEHSREKKLDWNLCVTTGSQDGLSKIFDLFLDEEDVVITENPTYRSSSLFLS